MRTLSKSSPQHEIERALVFASVSLESMLSVQRTTPARFAERVSLRLTSAPREERPLLHWNLAAAYWLTDRQSLALKAAKKYLSSRQPTEWDSAEDSLKQRLGRTLKRGRKR